MITAFTNKCPVNRGRRKALLSSQHDVVGLARSEAAAEALKRAGCSPHLGDITDPAGLTSALAGADAVVLRGSAWAAVSSATPTTP